MEQIKTDPVFCVQHNMNKEGKIKSLQIFFENDLIKTNMGVGYLDSNNAPLPGEGMDIPDTFSIENPPAFILAMFNQNAKDELKQYMTSKMQ